ncbi:MAG: ubiquinol-cytochrome C chaperone family protein [Magnetococcales bacterium]|nr:ubiquinol-cytochrome C chaperone family protein [Magnetococcales bacterium]
MALHDRMVAVALGWTAGDRLEVTDDFPLRFDVMILLVAGVVHRLHHRGEVEAAQALWDMTFEGLEESLRQRGVTDLSMARRMKKLVRQATGRRDAYLAPWDAGDGSALRQAVARNVFNGADPEEERVSGLIAAVEGFVAGV